MKPSSLTLTLNQPFNKSPLLVRRKISEYFTDELSGSDCMCDLELIGIDNITSIAETRGPYIQGSLEFSGSYRETVQHHIFSHTVDPFTSRR